MRFAVPVRILQVIIFPRFTSKYTHPCVRRGTSGKTHASHSLTHTACTLGGVAGKSEPGGCGVMLPRGVVQA